MGSPEFVRDYGLRAAYVAGAMVKGIASVDLVTRMGRSGYLAFYGSGGMRLDEVQAAIETIQQNLRGGEPYGVNLLSNPSRPQDESEPRQVLVETGPHHQVVDVAGPQAGPFLHQPQGPVSGAEPVEELPALFPGLQLCQVQAGQRLAVCRQVSQPRQLGRRGQVRRRMGQAFRRKGLALEVILAAERRGQQGEAEGQP